MQPDDIIQTKEWQQLTDAERKAVAPLAANQGEYNILKKMLLLAQEDVNDVPEMNSLVRQNLHGYLQKPASKRGRMFWYSVAASVILIAFAAFFLLQPKKTNDIANAPQTKPAPQKPFDSLKTQPAPILPLVEETKTVKQHNSKPSQKDGDVKRNRGHNDLLNIAQVNTSVIENTELLAFVTEVY